MCRNEDDFLDEVPTNELDTRVITPAFILKREVWEEDTQPEVVLPQLPPDVDPYSTVGDDWSVQYGYPEMGGESG